ncbi:TAP-like protein-domain-containing protein [Truncatella angustata]|uniref:TAP-like protein-domain-containing protein n=1 Tax=Truncatella angustata TaxID=152316 RepID=A0A9P8ZUY3_9PEZI|nr:TAP-like protein-domain-containing protein [Truncatella angustata]KAH6648354.1 TAP-like protein-domain-containing protein [Truncatella angustata]
MAALKSSPLNDASVMRPTGIYLPKASSSVASRSARQGRACSLLIGVIAVWTLHFLCTGDITSALLITSGAAQSIHNDQKPASASGNFRWSDVGPSRTLQYTPCFGSYQCARLSVPLNWNASIEEQEASPRAAIAIIKLPAKVPVTDSRYGGPILMNPGGPGESGVYQVAFEGQHLQTVVDSHIDPLEDTTSSAESGKYFDVIGFDPRGVNNTTPRLRCFPDAFNQQAWLLRYLDFGLLWSSESVVGYEWARASALGASCAREEADGGILRYANTAQVAGDMVQIVEKEGEWRAAEAARILEKLDIRDEGLDEIMERTAYRAGQEKLQYWGKSYGTVIGATVSALYPERVKRVILDGVVDPADHYSGGWLTQLLDSDKIVSKFSFSPSDIESRFTSILLSLKKNPIPVMLPPSSVKNSGPELVTYGDAHLYLLSSMYFTFSTTEMFWDMLIALESRDTTSPTLLDLVAQKQARLSPAECDGGDDVEVPYPCVPYNSMLGPNQVIGCMDTGGSTNMTQDGYKEYLALLEAQSRWISPSWARNKLGCLGYAVQPAWRPDLTFETQKWDNTSHPLLIISNTHDPVTPIRNGRRVSTIFPGSVVLQQDSEGHCSHSNPSFCTARSIREYFQTGELPREGTVCQPEVKPFVGCIKEGGCDFEKVEEQRLWESLVDMADPFGLRRKNVTTKASTHFEAWSHLVSHKGLHT